MKLTKLRNDAGAADPGVALALVEAVGTQDFAARLLGAAGAQLPASHCTVFALQSNGRVEAISSASAIGEVATLTAIEYMRLGFDRQDSNMLWLAKRKPAKTRQFWLGHQFAHEVANEQYRLLCYGQTGIRERLSLLSVFPDGYRVSVSFYRNHSYRDYGPRDLNWLQAQGALIGAAVMRHVQLGRRDVTQEHDTQNVPLQHLTVSLPARERELVAHVVGGCTTKEAARRMGISLTTALTYRYRAFQRLGIRSHRELIGLISRATLMDKD